MIWPSRRVPVADVAVDSAADAAAPKPAPKLKAAPEATRLDKMTELKSISTRS
ncbi:hypothetical protein KX816_11720 [Sphingosinicellaceae bacterium]|nr:hypothetical protein KX816_11720 [Sphingosinicellaceae bacterium]